jgi:hypothetical protein
MSMLHGENIAIDWSKVFAVRRYRDAAISPVASLVALYADISPLTSDNPFLRVENYRDAARIWHYATADKRFTLLENLLVDLCVIKGVFINKDLKSAALSFELPGSRRFSIETDAVAALDIIASFPAFPEICK